MKLNEQPFLIIDCQTTGMRPSVGQILELGWGLTHIPEIESRLVELSGSLPPRVSELTGIFECDLKEALPLSEVFATFNKTLTQIGTPAFALIHYAQFERSFLKDLFEKHGITEIPFEIICTHQITKKLFPNLPSQNIRGTAGFFGDPVSQIKRSKEHVRATKQIWTGIVQKLSEIGIEDIDSLKTWLAEKKKIVKGKYDYRIESAKRLNLPDVPGVYRMLAKTGEILYVGKATSLKSRVNSYFRGKAGRDKRKLEMLAQVWDLNVTECKTALEAALLEADEIKKHNPPYNVMMKKGRRHLVFYSRDFSAVSRTQDHDFPLGPFRNSNWIEHLRALHRSMESGLFEQIFFDYIPPEQLKAAFHLFCRTHGLHEHKITGVRSLLAFGLNAYRNFEEPEADIDDDGEEPEEPTDHPLDDDGRRIFTDEEVVGKFERLFRRAGAEHWRGKHMTKLLDADVTYIHKGEPQRLRFSNGFLASDEKPKRKLKAPWENLDVETFDRMSVLLSELEKYEHTIRY